MLKIHKLEDVGHFQRMHDRWIKSNSRALELLKAGEGDVSVIYRGLCNETLDLGCMALILGKGDAVAQAHFRKAADYALDWLDAPGGTSRPRVYDVNVEVSERTTQITSVHERKPTRAPRKLSITAYSEILSAVVAFGDGAGMKEVAAFPE
jgi:hypothetical protein